MIDWTDKELLLILTIDILAVSFAIWWLSGRVRSKIDEVNQRRSNRWERENK